MYRRLTIIFVLAFALDWLWENLHAPLYLNYKGGPVTEWILTRAAFWDAVIITALAIIFLCIEYFRKNLWWALVSGIAIAAAMEKWALATERWAYGPHMPIIPVLGTGLTPTIQLGLIAFCIFYFVLRNK